MIYLFEISYLCIADGCRQFNIGFPTRFLANWPLSEMTGAFLFSKGSYRPLTFHFRVWIKRMSPMFQYLRQASVSDDLPVSTNDLPTIKSFCLITHLRDMQGKKSMGLKKVNLN